MEWWDKRGRLDGIWLLFWVVASSIWCVSASAHLSATFDEPTYVTLGLESWRTGSYKRLLDLGTMPLPPLVQTLPLHIWERWQGAKLEPATDLDRLLPIARLGTLPFWWLLLLYAWLAGRQIAGVWGGRLAVVFLACEPNLLAHASLATTDVAVSACLLALFYHFRAGKGAAWWKRVLIPTTWFALAVLSKASGLVFGIIGLTMTELEHRLGRSSLFEAEDQSYLTAFRCIFQKQFRRDLFQVCGLGLLLVFCFCGTEGLPSPSFVAWSRQLPEGPLHSTMVWIAEHLRIFSNAGVGLVRQIRHNVQGHGVFLLNQVEKRAIWYYFPLAISIKSPLPLLALPLFLALVCRRALRNWANFVACALLLFTLVCRVQTGIRLVLPLLSLLGVGLATALVVGWSKYSSKRRQMLLTSMSVLSVGWLLWASLSVWPEGLCYTNELWGGTDNGYRCLSDSNYDWGQGLKELTRWQQTHSVNDLDVIYYGTDPTIHHLPMRPLHVANLKLGSDNLPKSSRGRTLAVSTSILYGSVSEIFPELKAAAKALREKEAIDRTSTFFIYRLPHQQEIVKVIHSIKPTEPGTQ